MSAAALHTSSTIEFIPSAEFETLSESDLLTPKSDHYENEDLNTVGTLDSNSVASTLLSALQQSRLLTVQGEQHLFRKLNFLRFQASTIRAGLSPKRPSRKKTREIQQLLDQVDKVREELARANLRLVASIAGKLAVSRDEFDEFVAEGNGILLYAIDKFDYSRGYRFSTYVTHSVQRHLYRVINRRRKRAEREITREPELLVDERIFEVQESEPTEAEVREAANEIISKMSETLDERECFIVRGRFGLDGSGEGKPYRVLAEELGLSKERVRQLFQQAISKLSPLAQPFRSTFAPV